MLEPLLVIANADAGSDDAEALDQALGVLQAEASVEVAHTSAPGELDGVLHRAGSRRIVVAGGDGSLHAVVSALYRRHDLAGTTLGLLPLGTGNDFARGLGIPLDVTEAARVVLDGTPEPLDLVVDEVGQVVVNTVHVGVGAEAARRGAGIKKRLRKVKLGLLGYPIGAALAALDPPQLRLRVEVDGEVAADFDTPVLQVAIGNGPSVGGGTQLVPDARADDHALDVMISRAIGPVSRALYAGALALGRHTELSEVVHIRGERVSVSGEEFWCSADGEIYGPERHRSWRLEPAAYHLILPSGS